MTILWLIDYDSHRLHHVIYMHESWIMTDSLWTASESNEKYVVQQYLDRPLLIDGFKFDLRIYALITSCEPLRSEMVPVRFQYGSINTVSQAWSIQFNFRIYVYKEGLARFATTQYSGLSNTNMAQSCMHLTNYSINKYSDHFVRDDEEAGSKRKFSSIKKWFTEWVHVPIEHEIKHKINSYDLYSIGGIIIMMNYGDKLTI